MKDTLRAVVVLAMSCVCLGGPTGISLISTEYRVWGQSPDRDPRYHPDYNILTYEEVDSQPIKAGLPEVGLSSRAGNFSVFTESDMFFSIPDNQFSAAEAFYTFSPYQSILFLSAEGSGYSIVESVCRLELTNLTTQSSVFSFENLNHATAEYFDQWAFDEQFILDTEHIYSLHMFALQQNDVHGAGFAQMDMTMWAVPAPSALLLAGWGLVIAAGRKRRSFSRGF